MEPPPVLSQELRILCFLEFAAIIPLERAFRDTVLVMPVLERAKEPADDGNEHLNLMLLNIYQTNVKIYNCPPDKIRSLIKQMSKQGFRFSSTGTPTKLVFDYVLLYKPGYELRIL
jgi:hypothetical protein